ncbi:hypothetical protein GAMM_330002 [Gammaproteobacteria bacterium]
MVVSILGKNNKKYYGKNIDEASAKKKAAENKTSKEKLVLERAGKQYQGNVTEGGLVVGVRTVSKEEQEAREKEKVYNEAVNKSRQNLAPSDQENKVKVIPLSQINNPQDLARQTAVQQGIPIIAAQAKAINQEIYLVQTPEQRINKAYKESGGNLTGKELQEYYKYNPEARPTLQTSDSKKKANTGALVAGFRETPSMFSGLIGVASQVKVEKKALGFIPIGFSMRDESKNFLENPYSISQGERQFDSNFQKGLYQTGRLGGYIFNVATTTKGTEGILNLRTSQAAYNTAKAGKVYEGFFRAASIGKAGSVLNTGVKAGAGLGVTLAAGTMVQKTAEKATELRRNIGLDLKKQSKEYVAEEKKVSKAVGFGAATLSANVVSQAAGISYVKMDMFRKGASLTAIERGKNIFAAGVGEGAGITYFAQEANDGKTIYLMAGSKNKLARGAEMVAGGVIGGVSAAGIDRLIQSKRYGKAVEAAAYATDRYEYAGDVLEESFRGAGAFERVRPVRINTQADTFFKSFGAKTTTDTKNMQQGIKTEVSLKQRVNSLVNTKSAVSLKENTMLQQRTNTMVNTNTAVTTNTNLPVFSNTNVPVTTNTNLVINTKTNVPVTTKTNVPVSTKTNTDINTETNINEQINEQVKVFTPNIPFVAFGGGFGKGFAKGGRKALSKYKPSLLGIARGKKASKTTGLSGFEVRGLENTPKTENKPKSFNFGAFSVKPMADKIGIKFKVTKTKPKSNNFGKIGSYFKKVGTKSLL